MLSQCTWCASRQGGRDDIGQKGDRGNKWDESVQWDAPCAFLTEGIKRTFHPGKNTVLRLTYSCMKKGALVVNEKGDSRVAFDCSVMMISEIQEALRQVEELFRLLFSHTYSTSTFSLLFVPASEEIVEEFPYPSDFFLPLVLDGNTQGIGRIRFAFIGPGRTPDAVVNCAYPLSLECENNIKDTGGDIILSALTGWREDDEHLVGKYSLARCVLHQVLHLMGLFSATEGVMSGCVLPSDSTINMSLGTNIFVQIHRMYIGHFQLILATSKNRSLSKKMFQARGVFSSDCENTHVTEMSPSWQVDVKSLSVDAKGQAWRACRENKLWVRSRVTALNALGSGWTNVRTPEPIRLVSAGVFVWVVGMSGKIYVYTPLRKRQWNSISPPSSYKGEVVSLTCAAAAWEGTITVACVDIGGRVWKRRQVTFDTPAGTEWVLSCEECFATNSTAGARVVSSGLFGQVICVLDSKGCIYVTFSRHGVWKRYTGPFKHACVTPAGDVVSMDSKGNLFNAPFGSASVYRVKRSKTSVLADSSVDHFCCGLLGE